MSSIQFRKGVQATTALLLLVLVGTALQGLVLGMEIPEFQWRLTGAVVVADLVLMNFSWLDRAAGEKPEVVWGRVAWILCGIAGLSGVTAALVLSIRLALVCLICCALGWVSFAVQDND